MKIQKNIRVPKEVADWMDAHPLSNNSLVVYALYIIKQIEDKATHVDIMNTPFLPTVKDY